MIMDKVKLRKHKDSRGSLTENTLPRIMKESKHFFVSKSKPEVMRGNHYHLRKSEWFYVIQGKCKLVIEDINTKKNEDAVVDGKENIAIHIGPNCAHAFKNIGKNELILLALINEVFDENDPDTYPYNLM